MVVGSWDASTIYSDVSGIPIGDAAEGVGGSTTISSSIMDAPRIKYVNISVSEPVNDGSTATFVGPCYEKVILRVKINVSPGHATNKIVYDPHIRSDQYHEAFLTGLNLNWVANGKVPRSIMIAHERGHAKQLFVAATTLNSQLESYYHRARSTSRDSTIRQTVINLLSSLAYRKASGLKADNDTEAAINEAGFTLVSQPPSPWQGRKVYASQGGE